MRLDGVKDIQIDLQTNLVQLTVPAGFVLETIPSSIQQAGYTPGKMTVEQDGQTREVDYRSGSVK